MKMGKKYQYLITAKENGINVPELIYISEEEIKKKETKNLIDTFLNKFSKNEYFIIRSATSTEDNYITSYAGFFYSSNEVLKENVYEKIIEVYHKNTEIKLKHKLKCHINIILQNYIPSKIGGIIFTPWKYYFNHFLVEYSEKGTNKAVSGEDSSSYILSLDNKTSIFSVVPNILNSLKHQLQDTLKKLHKIFKFSMDIEWGYFNNIIYIYQIRPITVKPYALEKAPKETNDLFINQLQIKSGSLKYTSLSESFGVISPLAFSLFNNLFKDSNVYYKKIGFKAEHSDFMVHMPNGCVAVNTDFEKKFYQSSSFFAPFFRTFYEKKYISETVDYLNSINIDAPFSYKNLCKIFGYWQISNIYVTLFHKDNFKDSNINYNEYDFLNYNIDIPFPSITKNNWQDIKVKAKQHFLYEMNKLKIDIVKEPLLVFADWTDYAENTIDLEKLKCKYNEYIKLSKYHYELDYSSINNEAYISIAGKIEVTGKTFVIKEPFLFKEDLPNDIILVAPYFKNDWIADIYKIKGIVLESGSILSHSAIFAREKNIPYFIKVKNAVEIYENKSLKLIPKKNRILILGD